MSRTLYNDDFSSAGPHDAVVSGAPALYRENTEADWHTDGDKAWGDGPVLASGVDARQVLLLDNVATTVFLTSSAADPNKNVWWEVDCFIKWPDVIDPLLDYTCGIVILAQSTPAIGFERVNWWWRRWPNSSPVESMELRSHTSAFPLLTGTPHISHQAADGLPAVTAGQTYHVRCRMRVFNSFQHCAFSVFVDGVRIGSDIILPATAFTGLNFPANFSAMPKNHGLYMQCPGAMSAPTGTPRFAEADRFQFDNLRVRDLLQAGNFLDPFPSPVLTALVPPTNTLAVEGEVTTSVGSLPYPPQYAVPMRPAFQTAGGGEYDSGHVNKVAAQELERRRWGLNWLLTATEYATMRAFIDSAKGRGETFTWTEEETDEVINIRVDSETVQWAIVDRNASTGIIYRMAVEVEEVNA